MSVTSFANPGCMQTYSGKTFLPLDPRSEDVDIEDIAHSLAMQSRFTGHAKAYYSVAQHCVLASIYCESDPLWALLHDASEAYLGDIATPIKRCLHQVRGIEEKLHQAVAAAFGLPWPMPYAVKEVDLRMLATERRDLMAHNGIAWPSLDGVEPYKKEINPWDWKDAKWQFRDRFYQLTGMVL